MALVTPRSVAAPITLMPPLPAPSVMARPVLKLAVAASVPPSSDSARSRAKVEVLRYLQRAAFDNGAAGIGIDAGQHQGAQVRLDQPGRARQRGGDVGRVAAPPPSRRRRARPPRSVRRRIRPRLSVSAHPSRRCSPGCSHSPRTACPGPGWRWRCPLHVAALSANTANAPWLQAALTVPAVLVQLSLVPAPPTLQVPEPPSITPLFWARRRHPSNSASGHRR